MPIGDILLVILIALFSSGEGSSNDKAWMLFVSDDGSPYLNITKVPIMSNTKPMFINVISVIGYNLSSYF